MGARCVNKAGNNPPYCGLCVPNCGKTYDSVVCTEYGIDLCRPRDINAKAGGGKSCSGSLVCCVPTKPNFRYPNNTAATAEGCENPSTVWPLP